MRPKRQAYIFGMIITVRGKRTHIYIGIWIYLRHMPRYRTAIDIARPKQNASKRTTYESSPILSVFVITIIILFVFDPPALHPVPR